MKNRVNTKEYVYYLFLKIITKCIQENERYCYFVPLVPHPTAFLGVSQPQHYCCLGLDNCWLWEAALCMAECSPVILTSTHQNVDSNTQTRKLKMYPDAANCSMEAKNHPWLRTFTLEVNLILNFVFITFYYHFITY